MYIIIARDKLVKGVRTKSESVDLYGEKTTDISMTWVSVAKGSDLEPGPEGRFVGEQK